MLLATLEYGSLKHLTITRQNTLQSNEGIINKITYFLYHIHVGAVTNLLLPAFNKALFI